MHKLRHYAIESLNRDRLRAVLDAAADYFGLRRRAARATIATTAALSDFIDSRASHVAQTALYGYLKTRAGSRFPELFESDAFVESINHAKWQVWTAALADLAVFTGGLIARRAEAECDIGTLMTRMVDRILEHTGTPSDSGPHFAEAVASLRARIATCDWNALADDDGAFSQSPDALVRWAPIIEELKNLDADIVRNSVRFRWIEVRRELRATLDVGALLDDAAASPD